MRKIINIFIIIQLLLSFLILFIPSSVHAGTWDAENYTTYTETDPDARITVNNATSISSTCKSNSDAYVYKDYGAGYYKNFSARVEGIFNSRTAKNAGLGLFGLSNTVDDCYHLIYNHPCIFLLFWADDTKTYVYLFSNNGFATSEDKYECNLGVWYYFTV